MTWSRAFVLVVAVIALTAGPAFAHGGGGGGGAGGAGGGGHGGGGHGDTGVGNGAAAVSHGDADPALREDALPPPREARFPVPPSAFVAGDAMAPQLAATAGPGTWATAMR
jgi:hypothetical protein